MNSNKYTRKDFLSATEPRWCIGCGNYAIFNALTRMFLNSGKPRESFALISGIGCSSRLPYYSNTYGFHTIHGRAPAVATGLMLANSNLSIWVITGDGDALSIGGNHYIHLMRRNPNIKVLLLNNEIYGLTKGQTSPTSPLGFKSKSAPFGNHDRPVHALTLALGAGATFVARVPDNDNELIFSVLEAAEKHQGVAVIEVLTNCIIFNDGAFSSHTSKDNRAEKSLNLRPNDFLIYGKNNDKGIRMNGSRPESVNLEGKSPEELNILKHDISGPNLSHAFMLAEMGSDDLPMPLGILRQANDHVFAPNRVDSTSEKLQSILEGPFVWTQV